MCVCARWCSLNFVQYCTNVYKVCLHSINVSPLGILCVCVCVPFPCLASFLRAGTHGPHRRLAALHDSLAPPFPLSPSLLCSLPRLLHLLSPLFFHLIIVSLFSPLQFCFYSLLSSFSLLPTSSPFIPDPHGRRAFGCHPLSHALPASDCNVK